MIMLEEAALAKGRINWCAYSEMRENAIISARTAGIPYTVIAPVIGITRGRAAQIFNLWVRHPTKKRWDMTPTSIVPGAIAVDTFERDASIIEELTGKIETAQKRYQRKAAAR